MKSSPSAPGAGGGLDRPRHEAEDDASGCPEQQTRVPQDPLRRAHGQHHPGRPEPDQQRGRLPVRQVLAPGRPGRGQEQPEPDGRDGTPDDGPARWRPVVEQVTEHHREEQRSDGQRLDDGQRAQVQCGRMEGKPHQGGRHPEPPPPIGQDMTCQLARADPPTGTRRPVVHQRGGPARGHRRRQRDRCGQPGHSSTPVRGWARYRSCGPVLSHRRSVRQGRARVRVGWAAGWPCRTAWIPGGDGQPTFDHALDGGSRSDDRREPAP